MTAQHPPARTANWLLIALAMLAFAANSLLCRQALATTAIDAATFTAIRLAAGAALLLPLARPRLRGASVDGSWPSALALFAYAAGFSLAYRTLPASTGALLLFGAVQVTMIGVGMARGERLRPLQAMGFLAAIGGLGALLLPGLSAPPLVGAALMLGAGVAWGVYSLRGSGGRDPVRVTAGNFVRAVPFALLLSAVTWREARFDAAGCGYAIASGAVASGLGYAVWYTALRGLSRTVAATVQLSVPVLAGLGGTVLLGELLTARLAIAGTTILGGIALVLRERGR